LSIGPRQKNQHQWAAARPVWIEQLASVHIDRGAWIDRAVTLAIRLRYTSRKIRCNQKRKSFAAPSERPIPLRRDAFRPIQSTAASELMRKIRDLINFA
jgi:hypothetical protein